jgi:hypothetical protein
MRVKPGVWDFWTPQFGEGYSQYMDCFLPIGTDITTEFLISASDPDGPELMEVFYTKSASPACQYWLKPADFPITFCRNDFGPEATFRFRIRTGHQVVFRIRSRPNGVEVDPP